jgi:hypothetical protein
MSAEYRVERDEKRMSAEYHVEESWISMFAVWL